MSGVALKEHGNFSMFVSQTSSFRLCKTVFQSINEIGLENSVIALFRGPNDDLLYMVTRGRYYNYPRLHCDADTTMAVPEPY